MASDSQVQGAGAATNPAQLTEREKEILTQAWGCLTSVPEVDFTRLAQAVGMTNPRSASNAWSSIKKKLFSDIPATPKKGGRATASSERSGTAPDSEKKRKRSAKKGTATAANGDEDGADTVSTPTKKRRTPAKRAAPAKETDAQDNEEAVKTEPDREVAKPEATADEAVEGETQAEQAIEPDEI